MAAGIILVTLPDLGELTFNFSQARAKVLVQVV